MSKYFLVNGEAIKTFRLKMDWSQNTLGKKLGVSLKAISQYENGRGYPSYKVMEKFVALVETKEGEQQ